MDRRLQQRTWGSYSQSQRRRYLRGRRTVSPSPSRSYSSRARTIGSCSCYASTRTAGVALTRQCRQRVVCLVLTTKMTQSPASCASWSSRSRPRCGTLCQSYRCRALHTSTTQRTRRTISTATLWTRSVSSSCSLSSSATFCASGLRSLGHQQLNATFKLDIVIHTHTPANEYVTNAMSCGLPRRRRPTLSCLLVQRALQGTARGFEAARTRPPPCRG